MCLTTEYKALFGDKGTHGAPIPLISKVKNRLSHRSVDCLFPSDRIVPAAAQTVLEESFIPASPPKTSVGGILFHKVGK